MRYTRRGLIVGLVVILALHGCDSGSASLCDSDNVVALAGGSCIAFEGNAGAADESAIEQVIRDVVADVSQSLSIDGVRVLVKYDPMGATPEIGFGGYAPSGDEVELSVDPSFPNLTSSIQNELRPLMAHELHHVARWRTVGYGGTLRQAIVTEGLADHFSMEFGRSAPPIWSLALVGDTLDSWIAAASQTWDQPGYSHSGWFLGGDPSIPRWAGYAIGYELVGRHLAANPEVSATSLVDSPATTIVP